MTRRLLGEVEFHRQRAAGVRAAAREIAVLAQIQIVADEAGVPLSSVSQGLAGSNGRDVGLVLLSALAEHDHDRKLGDALAALWGCELRPLPDRSPTEVQALKELEDLRAKVSAAIDRLK